MNLLEEIRKNLSTSPLFAGSGRFCIEENLGSAFALLSLFKEKKGDYLLISNNLYAAEKTYNFLLNFLSEDDVVFFPSDELLRAESYTSGKELLSQRLYALGRLEDKKPKIVICHPSSFLRFLPNPESFRNNCINLEVGKEYGLQKIKEKLTEVGYQAINKIEHSLQFASRGDILDVYSVSYLDPVRIEFFGDEIERISLFDISTQKSKKDLTNCLLLPASDIFLNDDELSSFAERLKERLEKDKEKHNKEVGELLEQNVMMDLEKFISHDYKPSLYKYFSFALNQRFNILDYFSPKLIYVANKEAFLNNAETIQKEADDFFLDSIIKGRMITGLRQYMDVDEAFAGRKNIYASNKYAVKADDYQFYVKPVVMTGRSMVNIVPSIQIYLNTGSKVVLSLPEKAQRESIKSLLEENGISYEVVKGFDLPEGNLGITGARINEGFDISGLKIVYFSPSELFGHKYSSSRFNGRFKQASILRSYEDLHPGDYVVHEYNGIAQFIGIKTIEDDGIHRDYLQLAYANNESLYVPLEQFRMVRKYSGREGAKPKLSHLSSKEWEKKKANIKKRINDLADRLLELYGNREKGKGFAFYPSDELQQRFEEEFPYELTEDQEQSWKEISADMEKEEIMDRLLCGDVGFGKTEIAFRAAFKAISSHKQVAMLSPTTLLARQHYEVALERFASFGIHIEVLSRLVPAAKQKQIIEKLEQGKVDFVIGTHRLLSKEVKFKDLGLLIVDEEQRFGVEQKERIKEMKNSVDVLTLSATPIPRTLQMSLTGLRPLSQINTAPSNRMPVQTYVLPYKFDVVTELIQRELSRDGQVFYIHNRVETIYGVASKLAGALGNIQIGVVHGKMEKNEIEDVMEKFYSGEIKLLVATSIIENGIDVPNANMIIVEDADRFGLSQLYQIKGRVGRGDRIAYAYLMYKEYKQLNEDAQKRIQAIQEFTDLGSGYKIAQRDLMIRGAGDLLGPEQAGFIDSIGLDLYLKMLNETIEAKNTGKEVEEVKPNKIFKIDAYIPKEYAANSDKLGLYQELDEVKDSKQLTEFSKKIRDIYGRIPKETALLIQKKRIDILAGEEEFASVDEDKERVSILLSDKFSRINGMGSRLFDELIDYISILKVTFIEKKLRISMEKGKNWIDDLEKILKIISKLYKTRES